MVEQLVDAPGPLAATSMPTHRRTGYAAIGNNRGEERIARFDCFVAPPTFGALRLKLDTFRKVACSLASVRVQIHTVRHVANHRKK